MQVETYHKRYGYYSENVLGDPTNGRWSNRNYLNEKAIHFAGKPMGRPREITDENKEELKQLKNNVGKTTYNGYPLRGSLDRAILVIRPLISGLNVPILPVPGSMVPYK